MNNNSSMVHTKISRYLETEDSDMNYTRTDYMEKRVSHHDYYAWMSRKAGVSLVRADPVFLESVRVALAAGDQHLNSITLLKWDIMASRLLPSVAAIIRGIPGEVYSRSTLVCMLKAAAIEATS